jgi:hypothetical protein
MGVSGSVDNEEACDVVEAEDATGLTIDPGGFCNKEP